MSLYDAVELLRREGYPVTLQRMRYALNYGKLQKPDKDSGGRYVCGEKQLAVWRIYWKDPPRPGPRRKG